MSSRPLEKVRAYVQRYQPELEPIIFEEPLPTSEIAAQALGVEVGQIAKSILFRAGEKYAMFVAAGDVRIHCGLAFLGTIHTGWDAAFV